MLEAVVASVSPPFGFVFPFHSLVWGGKTVMLVVLSQVSASHGWRTRLELLDSHFEHLCSQLPVF